MRRGASDGLWHCVSGDGSPVLLLHGIGRSREDWDEQHELLSPSHQVWSVDLPGFGGSSAPAGGMSLPTLAADIAVFLRAKDLGPIHVAGNSLGGGVALQLAADHPDLVRSLLLVDSVGFGASASIVLRLASIPGVGEMLLGPDERVTRRLETAMFHDPHFVSDDRVLLSHELRRRPGSSAAFLEILRTLGAPWGVKRRWRTVLLRRVRKSGVPTFAMWGAEDRIFPAKHLKQAARRLGAATHLFPSTGHAPQIEQAEEFARLALSFWNAVEKSDQRTAAR